MRLLIDGYNLLHALGMAPRAGALSLKRSRLRLLDWLSDQLGARSSDVCVVFDSKHEGRGSEQAHRAIHVRFASNETADDLIERMVREESAPAALTVISNDHRIQHAATRRGCPCWDCNTFIDWLQRRDATGPPAPRSEQSDKPDGPSDVEVDDWLKRFGE
jgi:predicted RNA-binding protein with PIN domain